MRVFILVDTAKPHVDKPRRLKVVRDRDLSGTITVKLPNGRNARLNRSELLMRGSVWHEPTKRLYFTFAGLMLVNEQREDVARWRGDLRKKLGMKSEAAR